MYKLIAFDLDGTFLDDRKHIPEENLRAIRYASEKDVHIVPATGRLLRGIPKEISSLPYIRYYILINGAKVYDVWEDKVISTAEISLSTAFQLFEHGREFECLYDCYINDFGYMERDMYQSLEEYMPDPSHLSFMRSVRNPVDGLEDYVKSHAVSVQKVQYFFKTDNLAERARQLRILPELFPEIKAASSVATNIEMNSVHAGKGPALKALCEALGFPLSEAIAFGDGLNDMDMLSAAGMGVAMKNGDASVLSKADKITEVSNNDGGVGKMIFELL